MNKDLEAMLNSMIGKDVNIYINGVITHYLVLENFEFWTEELITSEQLVLSSEGEEKYFYINLDEIQEVKICEELSEIRLIFNDLFLQIWIDLE